MEGYKVFNPDWTTNHSDIVFEAGRTYRIADEPRLGKSGLHFYKDPCDCLVRFDFGSSNHICLVEATGEIDDDDTMACTDELAIIREVPWGEVFELVHARGLHCYMQVEGPFHNVGSYYGFGIRNTGKGNLGSKNSGDYNTGSFNVGNGNSGLRNVGDGNSGDGNSGSDNAGDLNAGCGNEGLGNAGNRNVGRRNAGGGNVGNWNAGSCNVGSRNAGSFNSGDINIGDWNAGKRRLGCFCTEESQSIQMFDKPSDWTASDWFHSRAKRLLEKLPKAYTDESGSAYQGPSDELYRAFAQAWWESLPSRDIVSILLLPNFDAEKFLVCTGIDVNRYGKAKDVQEHWDWGEGAGLETDVQATDAVTDREYESERYPTHPALSDDEWDLLSSLEELTGAVLDDEDDES